MSLAESLAGNNASSSSKAGASSTAPMSDETSINSAMTVDVVEKIPSISSIEKFQPLRNHIESADMSIDTNNSDGDSMSIAFQMSLSCIKSDENDSIGCDNEQILTMSDSRYHDEATTSFESTASELVNSFQSESAYKFCNTESSPVLNQSPSKTSLLSRIDQALSTSTSNLLSKLNDDMDVEDSK